MFDEHVNCNKETIIHQYLKVQAQITVTPSVNHGNPKIYCLDTKIKQSCNSHDNSPNNCKLIKEPEKSDNKCTFTVTQVICAEIPITFGIDVDINKGIIHCGDPDFGPCKFNCEDTYDKDACEETDEFDDYWKITD